MELILEWDGMHETVITAEEIRRQCDLVLLRKDLEKTVRAKVYLRRGDAALALKDYAAADLSFQEASKLLPGDRECFWKIGLAKVKTPSEREESLKIANKIMKEHPNYAQGFYLAGLFYLEINNYLKAFEYLNKTIELDNTAVFS